MKGFKLSFSSCILLSMLVGIVLGVLLNQFGSEGFNSVVVGHVLHTGGRIFIAALKMLVIPLVLVSLVCGVTSLSNVQTLVRISGKTLGLYLMTTALAVSVALLFAIGIGPGKGFHLETEEDITFSAEEAPELSQVLIDMIPSNPFAALVEGEMLQIIVFALLVGVAITLVGERGQRVRHLFADLNAVVMKMVGLVMKIAPIGVFCLIAETFAEQGLDVLKPLLGYFLVVVLVLAVHMLGTYSLLLRVLGGLNPLVFLSQMRQAMMFAFSTASSSATIPVTLETVEERLGVKNSVASFTVPLGATINMDGTAIMQGVATVFIAHVYQVDLSVMDYLMVILTATLASIGTAGVPGVGVIMLAMVFGQVGLPLEGIALILGFDRLLDMARTVVNITGDAMVTCVVAKSENALDVKRFNERSLV